MLIGQHENDRPVHLFGGQIPAGDGRFGDMKEVRFSDCQGHVRVPNPFFGFFDSVGNEQRCRADERAQRVADHVVHLRHAEGATILSILDSCTENAADKRRKGDSAPTMPLLRQRVGQHQPQREEKENIHQHRTVELRLLLSGGKSGEWGEDEAVVAGCAGENRCTKYSTSHQERQNEVPVPPVPRIHM